MASRRERGHLMIVFALLSVCVVFVCDVHTVSVLYFQTKGEEPRSLRISRASRARIFNQKENQQLKRSSHASPSSNQVRSAPYSFVSYSSAAFSHCSVEKRLDAWHAATKSRRAAAAKAGSFIAVASLEAPYSQKTQSDVGEEEEEEEEEEEPEEEEEEEEEGRNQDAINLPDANSSRARRTVALAAAPTIAPNPIFSVFSFPAYASHSFIFSHANFPASSSCVFAYSIARFA